MASITDIKRRILELAPAPFQELCDTLLSKQGYGVIHGYGMQSGTGNTTIGNPDTYFRKENGKYVFVAYTIQQSNIYSKLKEDIDKCLDQNKTELEVADIDEIICCHTSSNLSAGDDKKLHELCEAKKIALTIWGLDEIANQVHNHYRSLARDYLGLSIDTNQILAIDDFITQYDANGMAAPLNTVFQFRDKEKAEIEETLKRNSVVIVSGKAGVGKTRLVLETIKSFAEKQEYKLLCVKNNNLGLYEDLVSATESPDKYLFFIDDANELAELEQILAYVNKYYLGYTVKVIVTVRDYAKGKVVSEVKKYSFPQVIEILPFSDEEIEGFLNDNLKIKNENYINQIIRIAKGNPRIAYMAGKLSIEKQNLSVIKDVSQLYDAYYEKYVDGTIGDDKDLCFVVGILSVINAVVLNNMFALQELLDEYEITNENFKNKIFQLAKMEVVEIQLDQVAALSDQCLANYMLYYVFFQKKIIPLTNVLKAGYKHFRHGVLKAISTILNLFESEETRDYCKQEILAVWDDLKRNQDECYESFVKDFHVFRPEEAFLLAQQKIDAIDNEKINIHAVDFNKNFYGRNQDILDFFKGYQYSEYTAYVMELLLGYCEKTEETLVLGYKWLEKYYGIDKDSLKHRCYDQRKVSESLVDAISNNNIVAMAMGFQWAKYSLAFTFRCVEAHRENTVIFYNVEIKNSEGVRKYREACWKILIMLASKKDWHDKIIGILDEYARNLRGIPDRDVALGECENVEQLLLALDCEQLSFLKVIRRLLFNGSRINIEYDNKWKDKLKGKEWELYKLFERDFLFSDLDYKTYDEEKTTQIIQYGKTISKSEILDLVQIVNKILSDSAIRNHTYAINHGLELIVQQFDKEYLYEFMNIFIQFGKNISVSPCVVLNKLNSSGNSVSILSDLKKAEFPQKNLWMFCFFATLPSEEVSSEMLKEFICFLKSDSDRELTSSIYRNLRMLDKFLSIEPNIYPMACSIIYEKRKYNSLIVCSYFEQLFMDQNYSPQELLSLFQCNMELLQDIYFYTLKNSKYMDYTGTFLLEFLPLGKTWLQKYSELFWEHALNHLDFDYHKNNLLWKSDNYMTYYDYIFYNVPEETYSWSISWAFSNVFKDSETDELVKKHQMEWITHIIIDNAKSERINIIFRMVCELSTDIRKQALKTFLDNNFDYEAFKNLPLVPDHWSGEGSFVPAYQEQIKFLESLFPYVLGMKYLKHKARIMEKIEELHEMIKEEEIRVICRNLYM